MLRSARRILACAALAAASIAGLTTVSTTTADAGIAPKCLYGAVAVKQVSRGWWWAPWAYRETWKRVGQPMGQSL